MINQSSTHSWTKKTLPTANCQLEGRNVFSAMRNARCINSFHATYCPIFLYIYIYIYQLVGINIIWLVVWNMAFIFHFIWDVILPIDELIFFKMVETTNQYIQYISIYIYMGSGQKSLLRKSESSCEINFRQ